MNDAVALAAIYFTTSTLTYRLSNYLALQTLNAIGKIVL